MDEKFRKQMRETFVRGNEFYAGQKPNGAIARILKDHTWSDKYQKVVPHKGRYALLFQDTGGGGQVIAFAPEQLEKALRDLKQQGYEQLVGTKPATAVTKESWQMTRKEFRQRARVWKDLTFQEKHLAKEQYIKETGDIEGTKENSPEFAMESFFYDRKTGRILGEDIETPEWYIKQALAEGKPVPIEVLKDYPALMPVIEKEPWQMTQDEFATEQTAAALKGKPELKQFHATVYDEYAKRHSQFVKLAIATGKPVPQEVLSDYPELVREFGKPQQPKTKQVLKPLPPDAQNVQTLPFDSQLFDCYGKPTRQGFRAYCRRQK